ncbi:putative galacturonosyltransferase [Dirofilaria immitis]
MDGCTLSALSLIVIVSVLYHRDAKGHTLTIFLMALSYTIFNLIGLSEAISFLQRIDTTAYTNQLYATNISRSETTANQNFYFITAVNTSKSEAVTETVATTKSIVSRQKTITSKSRLTLLTFTAGRNRSAYVTNFSLPNAQVKKLAMKQQTRRDGDMFLYLFTVISVTSGFISMTIFSLLYFNFILPPQSEMS